MIKIYDIHYQELYKIDGNIVYDYGWRECFRIDKDKNMIYDNLWRERYRIDGNMILDVNWTPRYRIDGNIIRDANNWAELYRIER